MTGFRAMVLVCLVLALMACQPEASKAVPFPDAICDDGGFCQSSRDDRHIRLRFLAPPNPLEAFPFEVRLKGFAETPPFEVQVRFEMTGMDMGLNRYRLQHDKKGHYTGRAVLPVCTSGRHDWQAVVTVVSAGKVWEARFRFQAGK